MTIFLPEEKRFNVLSRSLTEKSGQTSERDNSQWKAVFILVNKTTKRIVSFWSLILIQRRSWQKSIKIVQRILLLDEFERERKIDKSTEMINCSNEAHGNNNKKKWR